MSQIKILNYKGKKYEYDFDSLCLLAVYYLTYGRSFNPNWKKNHYVITLHSEKEYNKLEQILKNLNCEYKLIDDFKCSYFLTKEIEIFTQPIINFISRHRKKFLVKDDNIKRLMLNILFCPTPWEETYEVYFYKEKIVNIVNELLKSLGYKTELTFDKLTLQYKLIYIKQDLTEEYFGKENNKNG